MRQRLTRTDPSIVGIHRYLENEIICDHMKRLFAICLITKQWEMWLVRAFCQSHIRR